MDTALATVGVFEIDLIHVILTGLLVLAAGIALGVSLWLFPYKRGLTEAKSERDAANARLYELDRQLASETARTEGLQATLSHEREQSAQRFGELEQARKTLQARLEENDRELSSLKVREEERQKRFEDEKENLVKMKEEVEIRFKEIAQTALRQQQSFFLETANETFGKQKEAAEGNLKSLMSPIREAITKFETRVEGLEKVRAEDKSAIFEQVKGIGELLARNQNVTSKLVSALSSPKGGGRWGEESLRNVMEMAGLSEHADFTEQDGSGGDGLRPDVIIRMPGGREIVVDSKVSIQDFLLAAEEADEGRRDAYLAAHARKMKDHVKRLASKEYWKAFESRVDFVAMYIPGENFYAAALQVERDLFDYAARNRVLIVTPSTLIALAKAVAYGWRQEEASKNALEAAKLGRDLHKRLSTFTEHMEKVGTHLGRSVSAFNKMSGSYERMVLPQARRFETLQLNDNGSEIPNVSLIEEFPASANTGLLNLEDDEDETSSQSTAAE